jgi:hypothetical protein
MQHSNNRLKFAFLTALCLIGQTILHAQDPLDQPVRLKVKEQPLIAVLNQLSAQGYCTFSYKSDDIKKDRLVTLTLRESTLREALATILEGYDFSSTGDYVVIRKGGVRKEVIAKEATTKAVTPKFKEPTIKMKKVRISESPSPELDSAKQVVRNIITDMIAEKIVKDKDSFGWFGLDGTQFVVDGRPQPDSLRQKFQAKYIKPDGLGYYFGSVSVHGTGVFFERADIY